jgi:hypothetical protein
LRIPTNGKPFPEFIDDAGQLSHAAFVALRITADISRIKGNVNFYMAGKLAKVGSAIHFSHHTIIGSDGASTEFEML